MRERSYIVADGDVVKERLELRASPTILYVKDAHKESCNVELYPPDREIREIRVSDDLLQELLENEHIRPFQKYSDLISDNRTD